MGILLTEGSPPADCTDPGLTGAELLQCTCYPKDFEVSGATDARWPRIAAIEQMPFVPFAVTWEERSGEASLVRLTVFYQKTVAGPANPHLLKSVDVVVDQSSDSARGVHTPDVAVTYASTGNPPVQVLYLVVSWVRETTAADGADYLRNVRMKAYRLDFDSGATPPFALTAVGSEVKLVSDAFRIHHPAENPTARWGPAVAGYPTDAGMGAGCMVGILQRLEDPVDPEESKYWPTWAYYGVDDTGLSQLAGRWYAEISEGDVQHSPEALFVTELSEAVIDGSLKIDVAVTHHDDPAWDGIGFLAWPSIADDGAPAIHLLAEKASRNGGTLTFAWPAPQSTTLYDPACRDSNDNEGFPDLLAVPAAHSALPRVYVAYSGYIDNVINCPHAPGDSAPSDMVSVFGRFVGLDSDNLTVSFLEGIAGETGLHSGGDAGPSAALLPGNRMAVSWNASWAGKDGANMDGAHGLVEDAGPLWTVDFSPPEGGLLFGTGTKVGTGDADPVLTILTDSRLPIVYAWGLPSDTSHAIRLDVEQ